MAVTEKEMQAWCETLLAGRSAAPDQTLSDYIRAIPGVASLEDLPKGSPVLVRGDLDCKPGPQIGDGDIRLRSMVDTLRFGLAHMVLNLTVVGLYVGNFLWRHNSYYESNKVGTGQLVLSAVAIGLLLVSGWIGGMLAYRFGVRVAAERDQAEGYSAAYPS